MNKSYSFKDTFGTFLTSYLTDNALANKLISLDSTNSSAHTLKKSFNSFYNSINPLQDIRFNDITVYTNTVPSPTTTSTYSFANIRIPANGYTESTSDSINTVKNSVLENSKNVVNTAYTTTTLAGLEFEEAARSFFDQFKTKNQGKKILASAYLQFLKDLSYLLSNIRKVDAFAYCKYNQYKQSISFTFCSVCSIPYTPAYTVLSPTMKPSEAYDKQFFQNDLYHFAVLQSPLTTTHIAGLATSKHTLTINGFNYSNIPLIYGTSFQSDTPTFDINDVVGTNGMLQSFKTITYETYNVFDNFDIENIFRIKDGEKITYQQFFSALCFIFEQWRNNLKTVNIDLYVCHYNCHGNTTAVKLTISNFLDPTISYQAMQDETADNDYNLTDIMFVLRYKNFSSAWITMPDGTSQPLSNIASHTYEQNFNPPTTYYNQMANWEGIEGGGNGIIDNILHSIDMTVKYTFTTDINSKDKDTPYIMPLTVNYPILASSAVEDFKVNMTLQLSSLHNKYYGQIMKKNNNTLKLELNPWVHSLQFGVLTSYGFNADNSALEISAIKAAGSTHAGSLRNFSFSGIDLPGTFNLQTYVSEENQDTVYIMNDMILDSLSIHNGHLGELLTNVSAAILNNAENNGFWPPSGKTEFTSTQWEDPDKSHYYKGTTDCVEDDNSTYDGIRKTYTDRVATYDNVKKALDYVNSEAANAGMGIIPFIARCLPHGQILIMPKTANVMANINKAVKLKSNFTQINAKFRGLNYLKFALCDNITTAPTVEIASSVVPSTGIGIKTFTKTVYSTIDDTPYLQSIASECLDISYALTLQNFNYSLRTASQSQSTYVESHTYNDTVGNMTIDSVTFSYVNDWKTELEAAINECKDLYLKVEPNPNNTKVFGAVSFPIAIETTNMSNYAFPTTLALSNTHIGANVNALNTNLIAAIKAKGLNIRTDNSTYKLEYGTDYIMRSIDTNVYDELSSKISQSSDGSYEPSDFKINIDPTSAAQNYLTGSQSITLSVKFIA